jgi:hypothetical protein
MPPWKAYASSPGATADHLKYFCDQLFGPNQKAFRDQFFTLGDEKQLRQLLGDNQVIIPPTDANGNPVRIMVVDVEYARCFNYPPKIDPVNDLFYLLVMPPVPTKYDKEMQAWDSAWYHAIADGFGM